MNRHSVTRRQLLLSSIGIACSAVAKPRMSFANNTEAGYYWDSFVLRMSELADEYAAGQISRDTVTERGIRYLAALDIESASFADAAMAAYESGNEFWLWQRMLKKDNVNGGILNIDNSRLVKLHDHPGASGMLRIISGETEVWQYDRISGSNDDSTAKLRLVDHRILKPGDTSVLTPEKGNIHALRSVTAECRMLDFFIPPYQQNQRTWFEPLTKNWQGQKQIDCRCISQYEIAET